MGKPTICICENKSADQIAVTAKLISAFVFATRIVQFLLYLTPKFQASSSFLCLYRPVYVGPVRKPHCWFSHEAAHLYPHSPAGDIDRIFSALSLSSTTRVQNHALCPILHTSVRTLLSKPNYLITHPSPIVVCGWWVGGASHVICKMFCL